MKKILSLVLGMGLVLSLGMAYAEEGMSGTKDTSDKMIGNDDLQRNNLDQDRATVNQMPAEPGSEAAQPPGASAGNLKVRVPISTRVRRLLIKVRHPVKKVQARVAQASFRKSTGIKLLWPASEGPGLCSCIQGAEGRI